MPGSWEVTVDDNGAMALYRDAAGNELGFALAGNHTNEQKALAKRMPPLLVSENERPSVEAPAEDVLTQSAPKYECDVCSYVYDPVKGDPDGGIPPGTAWEDIPDDWVCPVCGAGKNEFTPIS